MADITLPELTPEQVEQLKVEAGNDLAYKIRHKPQPTTPHANA